ncbi:MAG: YidB family protein [Pseudomonadota bacterium]
MGILDMLTSVMASRAASELDAAVIPVVLREVLGTGEQGGLTAIVAKLQEAGFGDQVKSWIGNGQNLPISAQQLQEVLGSNTVRQLAVRFGIPVDQLPTVLAQVLPPAVDTASPTGSLPSGV